MSVPAPKSRSCVICRTRKVRCDKQSPCSNCRRAKTACVFPSTDRLPRWARRFERRANNASTWDAPPPQDIDPNIDQTLKRLRNVENIVKELSGQLEQARAETSSSRGGSSTGNSPGSSIQSRDAGQQKQTSPETHTNGIREHSGRLVVQDTSRIHYVSSSFWSRIDDELDALKTDSHGLVGEEAYSSEDEASSEKMSAPELGWRPSEHYGFLFRHNLSPSRPKLRDLRPLPSQIPFLLEIFSENVNILLRIVHISTVTKLARDLRGSSTARLTSSDEALMFSIYYAAVISMEEDEVMANFGSSKTDLSLKYRIGFERALAEADFLNNPNLVLVQAFALFLCLVRRHDSPRFVWMMTGLLIRMAQYLGLQRDGSHFDHLSPFEVEMRRRIWWIICLLDARASQDQGTDLAITSSSFDTKIPSNINEADIQFESRQAPNERQGVTDSTFPRIIAEMTNVQIEMMSTSAKDGTEGLKDQSRLLNKIYEKMEHEYLQYTTESANAAYWVVVTVARLTMAKMTLLVFLPVLSPYSSGHHSDEIRAKLLISAIEVAEYNHELNARQACRQWRWVYQTYTHWYAIVYLMLVVSQRPWSPLVERAWVALHSSWLIPARTHADKDSRIWVPLRALMGKARKHRDAELNRLRADSEAAARLEMEDQQIPDPLSSGPFPNESSADTFRERWRQLVAIPILREEGRETSKDYGIEVAESSTNLEYANQPVANSVPVCESSDPSGAKPFEPTYLSADGQQADEPMETFNMSTQEPATTIDSTIDMPTARTDEPAYGSFPMVSAATDWSDDGNIGPGFVPWSLTETGPSVDSLPDLDVNFDDINMNLDGEVNWCNLLEFAKGMERDTGAGSL
ncbi:MAG: hypothetical protein Q9165_000388 [Trypethelium subeluteriae]